MGGISSDKEVTTGIGCLYDMGRSLVKGKGRSPEVGGGRL